MDTYHGFVEMHGGRVSCFLATASHALPPEPASFHDALSGPKAAGWEKAMQRDNELQLLSR